MQADRSYGVVPVFKDETGEYRYLIVKQSQTHWSFPKGHAERGEEPMDAARRELAEETGITDVQLKKRPRFTISYFFRKRGRTVKKTVDHFLGFVDETVAITPQEEEILDYLWASRDEARKYLYRNTAKQILDKAHRYLTKRKRGGRKRGKRGGTQ